MTRPAPRWPDGGRLPDDDPAAWILPSVLVAMLAVAIVALLLR